MLAGFTWLRRNRPVAFSAHGGRREWTLTRHQEVSAVLADPAGFSSEFGNMLRIGPQRDPAAALMLTMADPPRHTELREAVRWAMHNAEATSLMQRVERIVDDVLDDALAAGSVDFVTAIADRIPMEVTCDLLGVPPIDRRHLMRLTTAVFAAEGIAPEEAEETRSEANAELLDYFLDLVGQRRGSGGDDFVSRLAGHDAGGSSLDDDVLALNCVNFVLGGLETTRSAAVGGVLALHRFPDEMEKLRRRPDQIHRAVEEIIRWTTPIRQLLRMCVAPRTLAGQQIAVGDVVRVWLLAANRDPEVFVDPDAFRVDRWPNRHLAFGGGPHVCVGRGYGRLELRQLFSRLVVRGIRVAPCVDVTPMRTPHLTAYQELPVVIETAG